MQHFHLFKYKPPIYIYIYMYAILLLLHLPPLAVHLAKFKNLFVSDV